MSGQRVFDPLSHRNEHILEAVRAIGRIRGLKFKVFDAVYYHKKRVKTVAEITAMTGLTRMQVLQSAGALKNAGIMNQTRKNNDTAYCQIDSFQHVKPQIIALLKAPHRIKEMATARNPIARVEGVAFVKPRQRSGARAPGKAQRRKGTRLRIAFLTTNPDPLSSLRTDMEVRDVMEAVKATPHCSEIEVRHLPAATVETLIDALNDFKPHILHFAGHAGGESLLFDNRLPAEEGGVVLDFDRVAAVIETAKSPPRVLVLSACDTVQGAERFLDIVQAVIAMSASIDDAAACHFSRRFYKSIASGATLEGALVHAKVVLQSDDFEDYDLPTLLPRDDEARKIAFFD